jgi:hypothetical protein
MTKLAFLREKLRRELQEVINDLDRASVEESEDDEKVYGADITVALRLTLVRKLVGDYVHAVIDEKKAAIEGEDQNEEEW